jgi:hypothetical protein
MYFQKLKLNLNKKKYFYMSNEVFLVSIVVLSLYYAFLPKALLYNNVDNVAQAL